MTTRPALPIVVALLLTGCVTGQTHQAEENQAISLAPGELVTGGLAFLTPTTAFGIEEDQQTLALIFTERMATLRPDVRLMTLPETLGAINRAGLTDAYKTAFADYRETGIFDCAFLNRAAEVTDSGFFAQLKLSGFTQHSNGRFSAFGIRLLETKQADIRVFFQIWDTRTCTVAWEGYQELNRAHDRGTSKPVTFRTVVEETADAIIQRLP